jgi:hypothetical protein
MGWGAIILGAALVTVPTAGRPIQLEVNQADGQLVIRLIGESQAPVSARYRLELASGSAGSSNHSVQSGTANLKPGKAVTLATLRVSNPAGARWTARLHVTPSSGDPYDLEWNGAR